MKLNRYVLLSLMMVILASCKKDETTQEVDSITNGMLVLCEGLFQQNNASLTWTSFSSGVSNIDFFKQQNNRLLGDTGNDIARYGGKIYIVVNVSSTIEVLSAANGKVIKQIQMVDNGVAKQPRYITFNGGKAYISCYDGYVDVLDTASLSIEQRIPVGANPEGLVVSNNRLFVANSGGLNYPNVDSTVSVIDLTALTEIQKIVVGLNPGDIEVDNDGDVYVISRGDYGVVPSRMHRINAQTLLVEETFNFDASEISRMNDDLLVIYTDASADQQIALFDATLEQVTDSNYLDLSTIDNVYEVQYNSMNNRVYVADAKDYVTTGSVYEFIPGGVILNTFNTGLNPSKMVFF